MVTSSAAPRILKALHFDIVGGCQLRCVGCPNSTLLPSIQHTSVEHFESCLRNIDVDRIATMRLFNYGEPLLHRDLPGILRAVARQDFKVDVLEISTNAQFARWEQIEEAVKLRMINRIAVSCDGDGTPESFERMRPPAKWDKLVQFLKRMKDIRDRHDPDLQLMTRTVILDDANMEVWHRTLDPIGWTPEFRRWKNLVDGSENLSGRDFMAGEGVCQFVEESRVLYVDWDGTVVPCCAHPRADDLGDLKTHRFSEISAGRKRQAFVDRLANDRQSHSICSRCEYGPKEKPGLSAGNRV